MRVKRSETTTVFWPKKEAGFFLLTEKKTVFLRKLNTVYTFEVRQL